LVQITDCAGCIFVFGNPWRLEALCEEATESIKMTEINGRYREQLSIDSKLAAGWIPGN